MTNIKQMLAVYFIAGTQDCRHLGGSPPQALLACLEQALKRGIGCFQFREKGNFSLQDPQQIRQLATQCRDLCRQYHVPFFVNDDVDLALALQADGVHVGQADRPVRQVIEQCQGKLLLGLSVNTLQQAIENAELRAVDYFGVGPIFPTQSKTDANAVVGLNLIRQIRQRGIEKPLVAIGGISGATALSIRQAGADGVAVISAITQAQNLQHTIRQLQGHGIK
ncbi:thiamine phosphate synthase [Testudinibacter sp. P80/BLE/0925]|uniref:thiamine phosphate synthase n=1 Tax=Testudinibacter sp. TW-1 TaxID=3417757 RepID=UPI003D36A702